MNAGRKRIRCPSNRYPSKSRSRSRSTKRYRKAITFKTNVPKPLLTAQSVHFRYTEYISVQPGVSGIADYHVFSANGLFDPDITGVGHQPAGFDQLMSLYDHYTVISSAISCTFANTDPARRSIIGVGWNDDATPDADWRVAVENGKSTFDVLAPENGGPCIKNHKQAINIGKVMGRPEVLDEDDLRGSSGSNPNDQVYWYVWAANVTAADPVFVLVTIDYYAKLTESRQVGLS